MPIRYIYMCALCSRFLIKSEFMSRKTQLLVARASDESCPLNYETPRWHQLFFQRPSVLSLASALTKHIFNFARTEIIYSASRIVCRRMIIFNLINGPWKEAEITYKGFWHLMWARRNPPRFFLCGAACARVCISISVASNAAKRESTQSKKHLCCLKRFSRRNESVL